MDNILICLGTIYHEPFEIWICDTFFQNNGIQVLQKDTLGSNVVQLHVADNNKHYFVIDKVIDMASHGHPTLNTFDMIKHHPQIFQITPRLHSLH
jgi:hypothetical protein